MELKYRGDCTDSVFTVLLIVLNGIEIFLRVRFLVLYRLLIVLNGIEMDDYVQKIWVQVLLIVLNGIEIRQAVWLFEPPLLLIVLNGIEIAAQQTAQATAPAFNRTKWN